MRLFKLLPFLILPFTGVAGATNSCYAVTEVTGEKLDYEKQQFISDGFSGARFIFRINEPEKTMTTSFSLQNYEHIGNDTYISFFNEHDKQNLEVIHFDFIKNVFTFSRLRVGFSDTLNGNSIYKGKLSSC